MAKLRKKERTAILDSLRAGVVPRIGQQHIQVGRAEEVAALLRNIETIADGGAAMRFIIGEYGLGKTFDFIRNGIETALRAHGGFANIHNARKFIRQQGFDVRRAAEHPLCPSARYLVERLCALGTG